LKKSPVQPKKHLGQHFLTDLSIAQQIANTLSEVGYDKVLEIEFKEVWDSFISDFYLIGQFDFLVGSSLDFCSLSQASSPF